MRNFYKICAGITLALTSFSFALGRQSSGLTLEFSDTDVAQVLRAVGTRTKSSIVYSRPKTDHLSITIHLRAGSVDEAVKAVAASAGLSYRKVDSVYVVAPADSMKTALQPYFRKITIDATNDPADELKTLKEAFPDSNVSLVGKSIHFEGVQDDVVAARRVLSERSNKATEVVVMKHVSPKSAAETLQSLYPTVRASVVDNDKGSSDVATGAIVLNGPAEDVRKAVETSAKVDAPAIGPEEGRIIESRVYHIKYSSAPQLINFLKSAVPLVQVTSGPEAYSPIEPSFSPVSQQALGQNGSSGSSGSGGSGGSSSGSSSNIYWPKDPARGLYEPLDRAKFIVLRGNKRQLDEAISLLEQTDVQPAQIAIQVQVVDTTPEVLTNLGVSWDWTRFGFYELPNGSTVSSTNGPIGGDFTTFSTKGWRGGTISRVPWSFEAFLKAVTTHTDSKIVAKPNLIVTDNDQANIFIGDTLRVQLTSSGALGATTTTVEEFPIGIIMIMRPRIYVDGKIALRIHPVVSTVTSVSSNGLPQTSEREEDTNVVTHDGQTIVLGGLVRDEDTKTIQEVPLLSKLPIVGELFRSTNHDKKHKEILIFITTHLVKDGESAPNPYMQGNLPVETAKPEAKKK